MPQRNKPDVNPAQSPSAQMDLSDFFQKGLACHHQGRLAEAKIIYEEVIKFNPKHFEALHLLGVIAAQSNNFEVAVDLIGKAIEINPNNSSFYSSRGNALKELKRPEEAIASYEKAISIKPNYAEAYSNRGVALQGLKRLDEALLSYDIAIDIKRDYAEAYYNRGNALTDAKRFDEALMSYDKAISINPHFAEAFYNRGNVLKDLKRLSDALLNYDKLITIRPDYAEAYSNRGVALQYLNRLDEALLSYEKAISIKPNYAEAYYNCGNTLQELGRLEESILSYEKAISINQDYAEAYFNLGNVLQRLKRLEEAVASYKKAFALRPEHEYLFGALLHTKMLMCDWHNFDSSVDCLIGAIDNDKKYSTSFAVLALTDSASTQLKASKIFVNDKQPLNSSLGFISKSSRKDKIRIGYYSADFREHPVSYLTAELFELHEKSKFELFAFYYGPADSSDIHKRVSSAFHKFIDVRLSTDKEVAQLSRDIGIDIGIDLTGNTADNRVGIFSYRAAPVQVSYLGYLGTMGAEYYDYLIADKTIIPAASQQYYSEKIIYLPSYQVNDSTREIADKNFTRAELGLPEHGFVFCCFNSNYKITPYTFGGWMRILSAVPDSVLFLYADNIWAEQNLKKEARKRGVSQTRLVFGARVNRSDYLARYRAADLFLDTLPYNAGTTASDALWAELPVLTCMGESFASRVAASLLNAIELPELITTTQAQYEATAIELATYPAKLKEIREKLRRNRLTTALFDTPRFVTHIEAAYTKMYELYYAKS